MSFTYRRERLESGWTFYDVLDGSTVVGRINRDRKTERFRFFPGATNYLYFHFEHADLKALEALIEQKTWEGKPDPYLPMDLDGHAQRATLSPPGE